MSERFPDEVLQRAIEAAAPYGGANYLSLSGLDAANLAAMREVLDGHLAAQDRKKGIYQAAEDLWEEIGGLCICQQQDTPHWCEDCQRKLGIVRNALRRAASDGSPR